MTIHSMGKCDSCGNDHAKLTGIRIVNGTFYGGLKVSEQHYCVDCKTKEFFYLDVHNTVKYNYVTTETKATIETGDDR